MIAQILQRLAARKNGVALAITLAFLIGGLSPSLFPPQAHALMYHAAPGQVSMTAPTCSQKQCNGQNPYSTHCAGTGASYEVLAVAYLTFPSGYQLGYLQLWWSFSCQTNWARYVCLHAGNCPDTVRYEVDSEAGSTEWKVNSGGVTAQLYLPKTRAMAVATFPGVPSLATQTNWY